MPHGLPEAWEIPEIGPPLTQETRSLGVVALALASELGRLAVFDASAQDAYAALLLKWLGPANLALFVQELNELHRQVSRSSPNGRKS